jgi:asparagine synthase (glutamine-hydrolysing)
MCGICGVACRDPERVPLDAPRLRLMTDALEHRGPDDRGELLAPGIALGVRRLSIIDVAHGHQPIANEDESVWAIQNGEIYNFRELRSELAGRHVLRSQCDTEVIAHLYEEHGAAFARRLTGMYAVAVWDSRARSLHLIRDRMGIKPLYVAELDDGLAFASEVKALVVGGLVTPQLDPLAAELFLAYGYVPGPYTLFKGVRKLMPATMLRYRAGQLELDRYWDLWSEPDAGTAVPPRGAQAELLERLRQSVVAHMVSDVPLGLMLSGGLDSSLVGALMSEASGSPVETFSVAFSGIAASDELADARRSAARMGAQHHELALQPRESPTLLNELLWSLEEPLADLSALGFGALCEFARTRVTVALSGQGADELLGGYRKHQIAYAADALARLPGGRALASELAAHLRPELTVARGLQALGSDDPAERHLAASRVLSPDARAQLLQDDFRAPDAEEVIRSVLRAHATPPGTSALQQTLYLDLRVPLVDQLFLYFDKMSMASSLEVRVPFVDHELAAFCMRLPDDQRIRILERKHILRRAARGLVDEEVLGRKKVGFFHGALPPWLRAHREGFVRDVLLDGRAQARGQTVPEAVAGLVDGAGTGGKKRAQILFCVLMLELWQRVWVDGDGMARRAALGAGTLGHAVGGDGSMGPGSGRRAPLADPG